MKRNWIILIVAGVALGLFVAAFSPWASSEPDGLERVAEDKGFIDEGDDPPYQAIADYVVPGVENERLATVLAGAVGVLIVAGVSLTIGLGLWAFSRARAHGTGGHERPPDPHRGTR